MDPYLGEIRLFSYGFTVRGWAPCNGQVLGIAQNQALYSVLGVNYGGDGIQTFGLPNLNNAFAIGQGAGPGLTPRVLGEMRGTTAVTLTPNEMPMHTHSVLASSSPARSGDPEGRTWAQGRYGRGTRDGYAPTKDAQMQPAAVTSAGASQAHNNMPPFLVLNYQIALMGVYPSRG